MGVRRLLGQFQIRFCGIYYACIRFQPAPVSKDERLSRFLFDTDKEVDKKTNHVKWQAFFHARGHDISVIRTDSMTNRYIWWFGFWWVGALRERRIEGRADFVADKLKELPLAAVPSVPPPKHANLTGWPADKEARRALAQRFANELARTPEGIVFVRPKKREGRLVRLVTRIRQIITGGLQV